eukprot:SAG22_NODE_1689_length_3806_cov_7.093067_2_plen_79_part_00
MECALWIAEHDQVGNRIEDIAGAAGVAELHTANEQLQIVWSNQQSWYMKNQLYHQHKSPIYGHIRGTPLSFCMYDFVS